MDEKNIEVKLTDGVLTMKGERQEEKEEKKKRKRREKEGLLAPGAQLRLRTAGEC
jgi:HSP20 family molecular chaperone IbpA